MIASLFLAALLQSAPVATPTPAPVPACTDTTPPPAGLEAWSSSVLIPRTTAPVGMKMAVDMKPSDQVKFALAPERAPAAGTYSGVVHFVAPFAGTYRVALSAGAWIDVVRDGKSLTSVAHMEGPACSGIRKIVDFTLAPGTYDLQVSGAKSTDMTILIQTK